MTLDEARSFETPRLESPPGTFPLNEAALDEDIEREDMRIKSKDLSRDTRIQILALHNFAKMSRKHIANVLHITESQVRYTIRAGHPTPSKRSGRRPILSQQQIDEIEYFVCSSRNGRRMPYKALASGILEAPVFLSLTPLIDKLTQ